MQGPSPDDHRGLRCDPWRVHGAGAAIHDGSALAGSVVARVARPRLGNRCVGRPWPHQVPAVAVQVEENGDGPVLLDPRLLGEPDAPASHLVVVPPEIVGLEEQEHPPACLVAHPCRLFRVRRFRQQQSRAATARAHQHPAFAARKWGVLDREPQGLGEEVDRLVVVTDDQGDGGNQVRHGSILYFQYSFSALIPRLLQLDPLDLHLERPGFLVAE